MDLDFGEKLFNFMAPNKLRYSMYIDLTPVFKIINLQSIYGRNLIDGWWDWFISFMLQHNVYLLRKNLFGVIM